ncbi:hypothetical protein MKK88_31305 [Methylobacterium sp. E-005]|uniref:TY-Chap domain-containing protein n=1 Tax=Methylobacterium sp. E-005 TaxID=2836549 RepID=UPI001FBA2171|nr:hypothetical protein [Methylobacterium sp. E-005]MCJ2090434.1 hypothetical protein [Methylobacterium sp. E-005]
MTSSLAAAEDGGMAASRSRFIAQYRCALAARLEEMHRRGPVEESRGRFIILALRDEPQRYVQCLFHDRDTRMLCEASSGAYGPTGKGRLHLEPAARSALRALGYVQASPRESFAREVELGDPPDVAIAAELMLAALHDGHGARPGSAMKVSVPPGDDPDAACGTPTS